MQTVIEKIKDFLSNQKLPGFLAHQEMIPENRPYKTEIGQFRDSAVNLILFENNERLNFVLTKRSSTMKKHSGQMSLPGGGFDESDLNLWQTAKRETFEEIGVTIEDEQKLGMLSRLIVPVSKFVVQPFVSFLEHKPVFNINKQEVEEIFIVDTQTFFAPDNIKTAVWSKNGIQFAYKYFVLQNEHVWGLTAMILSEFKYILQKVF